MLSPVPPIRLLGLFLAMPVVASAQEGEAPQDGEVADAPEEGADVAADVWKLYRASLERFGPVPACVERDNDIPSFRALFAEAQQAAQQMAECSGAAA